MKKVIKTITITFGLMGLIACGGAEGGFDSYGEVTADSYAKGGKGGKGGGGNEEPPACYTSIADVNSCLDPAPQNYVNQNGDLCSAYGECFHMNGGYDPIYGLPTTTQHYWAECCPQ